MQTGFSVYEKFCQLMSDACQCIFHRFISQKTMDFSLSHLDVFAVLVTGLVILLVTYVVILLCKSI